MYYKLKILWWAWNSRYQVSRSKPNPWRHGGRRGRKQPIIHEFRFPTNVIEYRRLCHASWKTCHTRGEFLRETWLRLVTPHTKG